MVLVIDPILASFWRFHIKSHCISIVKYMYHYSLTVQYKFTQMLINIDRIVAHMILRCLEVLTAYHTQPYSLIDTQTPFEIIPSVSYNQKWPSNINSSPLSHNASITPNRYNYFSSTSDRYNFINRKIFISHFLNQLTYGICIDTKLFIHRIAKICISYTMNSTNKNHTKILLTIYLPSFASFFTSVSNTSSVIKLTTPISNGGLLFHPPGAITGSAQGGISQHHFYLLPPKEGSYLLPSSNLSFSSCSWMYFLIVSSFTFPTVLT